MVRQAQDERVVNSRNFGKTLMNASGSFGCHCEERSDVAISLRLSTCRGTIIATATRLPRCARNDMRKTERPWNACAQLTL